MDGTARRHFRALFFRWVGDFWGWVGFLAPKFLAAPVLTRFWHDLVRVLVVHEMFAFGRGELDYLVIVRYFVGEFLLIQFAVTKHAEHLLRISNVM